MIFAPFTEYPPSQPQKPSVLGPGGGLKQITLLPSLIYPGVPLLTPHKIAAQFCGEKYRRTTLGIVGALAVAPSAELGGACEG